MTTTTPSAPRLTFRGGGGGGGGTSCRDSRRAACGLWAGVAGTPAAASQRFVGRVSWAAEPRNTGTPLRRLGASLGLEASRRPSVLRSRAGAVRFVAAVGGHFPSRCGSAVFALGRRYPVPVLTAHRSAVLWAARRGHGNAGTPLLVVGLAAPPLFGRRDVRRFRCPVEVFAEGDSTLHEHGFQIFRGRVVSRLPASSKVSVTSQVTRRGISQAFRPLWRLLVMVTSLCFSSHF